jgi:hypothetical protein
MSNIEMNILTKIKNRLRKKKVAKARKNLATEMGKLLQQAVC